MTQNTKRNSCQNLLSVVILNYNMKGLIRGILDSIPGQTYPASKFEVIVIDNGSTDGSEEVIRDEYPEVKLIKKEKNNGYAAMNLALTHAKGNHILFLNNDLTLEKNCLEKLMNAINTVPKNVGVVTPLRKDLTTGKVVYHQKFLSRSFYTCSTKYSHPKKYYEDGFTGFPLYKREVLDKLGTFIDPDYFLYAEDVDFCYRTRMIGYHILLVTDAVVYNMGRTTTKVTEGSAKICFLNERNLLQTFLKNVEVKNLFLYLPYVATMRITSLISELMRLRLVNFRMKLKAYCWVLWNLRRILAKRHAIQAKRIVSDKEIFNVISNETLFLKKIIENLFRKS